MFYLICWGGRSLQAGSWSYQQLEHPLVHRTTSSWLQGASHHQPVKIIMTDSGRHSGLRAATFGWISGILLRWDFERELVYATADWIKWWETTVTSPSGTLYERLTEFLPVCSSPPSPPCHRGSGTSLSCLFCCSWKPWSLSLRMEHSIRDPLLASFAAAKSWVRTLLVNTGKGNAIYFCIVYILSLSTDSLYPLRATVTSIASLIFVCWVNFLRIFFLKKKTCPLEICRFYFHKNLLFCIKYVLKIAMCPGLCVLMSKRSSF